jgi:hypothetical protein
MKYYETNYDEYISSVEKYNLHPEMKTIYENFPKDINNLKNMIIYGSSGVGKYSQVLYLLKKYSPTELKYDKKIVATTEKQQYKYNMSDIHYEIDMSLLGCNSKILWHEIFFQIIDIISVKQNKIGIIVCKNFHLIHSELLEIFYSYMQQYNHSHTNIKIIFFIITEHISFLPNKIINSCHILKLKRPSIELYNNTALTNKEHIIKKSFLQKIEQHKQKMNMKNETDCKMEFKNEEKYEDDEENEKQENENLSNILEGIDINGITNIKELNSFYMINSTDEIPNDIFNIICDNIITEILNPSKITFTGFRDKLYDLLTYNLDMNECLWYIIYYLIENNKRIEKIQLSEKDISDILIKTYPFFKYFNNNYRPIFHLESIMYYIVNKIHKFDEL